MLPLRIWRRSISSSKCVYQLPHWWICGASASNALRTSKSAGRSSKSTVIASTAAIAVSSSSRRDDRDRLAQVAHLVLREQRLVGRDAERREMPVLEQRHVLPRDHVDALHRLGLARVEVRHRRAVHGRAERLHPERAGHPDVVDEHGAPGHVGDAVVAGDACADRLHATPPRFVIAVPAAVTVRSNESPRAAAATASMILT